MEVNSGFFILIGLVAMAIIVAPQLLKPLATLINKPKLPKQVMDLNWWSKAVVFWGGLTLTLIGLSMVLGLSAELLFNLLNPTPAGPESTITPAPVSETVTVETVTPEPTVETVTPAPVSETVTPEPTVETVTPEPTVETVTPEPTSETVTPEPTPKTATPKPTPEPVMPEPTPETTLTLIPIRYVIKSGDILSCISQQYYGEATFHSELCTFNRNRNNLTDCEKLNVGKILEIPSNKRQGYDHLPNFFPDLEERERTFMCAVSTPTPIIQPTPTLAIGSYPQPVLTSPENGAGARGTFPPLTWEWAGRLGENEYFEVRIWHESTTNQKAEGWVKVRQFDYDISGDQAGKYYWTVTIVRDVHARVKDWYDPTEWPHPIWDHDAGVSQTTIRFMSLESEKRHFFFEPTVPDDSSSD